MEEKKEPKKFILLPISNNVHCLIGFEGSFYTAKCFQETTKCFKEVEKLLQDADLPDNSLREPPGE